MSTALDPLRLCQDDAARHAKGAAATPPALPWNGIDSVEPDPSDPRTLYVYLTRRLSRPFHAQYRDQLPRTSVTVTGGQRVTNLRVLSVAVKRVTRHSSEDTCLVVVVDREGDFSTYTLRLDRSVFPQGEPGHPYHDRFDPYYAQADFSFKTDCPNPLDCAPASPCTPAPPADPILSYLGRDYAGLRQTMLDRLALVMPDWTERHVPDLGIALVELFAYIGDGLSYYQDAVATEAYLATARLRTSVRRHVRLIDYPMHEGCNARAWIAVAVDDAGAPPSETRQPGPNETPYCVVLPPGAMFLSGADSLPAGIPITDEQRSRLTPGSTEVFELLADRALPPWPRDPARKQDDPVRLFPAHDTIPFYTWNNQECRLPRGSTRATLQGNLWAGLKPPDTGPCPKVPTLDFAHDLYLRPGDLLLFEEIRSPTTGVAADADPTHRHLVVLTGVTPGNDPMTGTPIVDVTWDSADALPFTLCLSATCPVEPVAAPGQLPPPTTVCQQQTISVARGNVLLVDHGATTRGEAIGPVNQVAEMVLPTCNGEGPVEKAVPTPARFRPFLRQRPLIWAQPLSANTPPTAPLTAAQLRVQDPRSATPAILLVQQVDRHDAIVQALGAPFDTTTGRLLDPATVPNALVWMPRPDLLASGPTDPSFVVEPEADGRAYLRFGDDEHGQAVAVGDTFSAYYRVGNGTDGNVGRERINRVAIPTGAPPWPNGVGIQVRNPFAAAGGTAPEPLDAVKRLAPEAFRTDLRRAVVPADYASLAVRHFTQVLRAAATRRWTGAGDLIVVAIDFRAAVLVAQRAGLLARIQSDLEAFRRIGHTVDVREVQYAPINLTLQIQLLDTALRSPTIARIRALLGNQPLPGGGVGFFYPDNFTFGQGVAASRLIEVVQGVSGVESVSVTLLRRLGETTGPDAPPFLDIDPLQIVRLDNDPNHAENGLLNLNVQGGR